MKEESIHTSEDLKRIIRKKWTVALVLTALVIIMYFGFLFLLAFNRDFFAANFCGSITAGIPMGIGLIVAAWLMTGIYVFWANRYNDASVAELLKEEGGNESQ